MIAKAKPDFPQNIYFVNIPIFLRSFTLATQLVVNILGIGS